MEQKFISWLEDRIVQLRCEQNRWENVLLGVGDDGAVLGPVPRPVFDGTTATHVLVADTIVDQVHFDLKTHDLHSIGHKAIAVNLSDIAAMGAQAESALVSLVLPRSMCFDHATQLFDGIAKTAQKYKVAIVGGDTCTHDGALVVSVTVTGRFDPEFKRPRGWRNNGCRAGDLIVVTGPLGGSILGSHLDFEPRLELANWIQQKVAINAATDISDSLLIDLSHLINKSGAGAVLDLERVPVTAAAKELSKSSGLQPVDHALQDGEDFELLISMTAESLQELRQDPVLKSHLFVIGEVVSEHVGEIVDSNSGDTIRIRGYEHS